MRYLLVLIGLSLALGLGGVLIACSPRWPAGRPTALGATATPGASGTLVPSPTSATLAVSTPSSAHQGPHPGAATPADTVKLEAVDWIGLSVDLDCGRGGAPDLGVQLDEARFDDVTGDGRADALIAVSCASSDGRRPSRLDFYDGTAGTAQPRRLATLLGAGDGPNGSDLLLGANRGSDPTPSVRVVGGVVTVTAATYAAGDAPCCPTLEVVDTFGWAGNRFARGKQVTNRVDVGGEGRAILQQIIGAMNAATSYRMHLAAAASAHSQEYAATIVYVAPDRSASVVDSDGLRFYTIAIGVTRYTSVDGKTWIAHPPLPGLPTGGFGLQVTPRQAVAMLPSDGSGLGGLQLRDPAAGQQFELRYDPQSFRLVSAVGEFPVDGGTQHLEIQFADYDNPSNTVTKPLP